MDRKTFDEKAFEKDFAAMLSGDDAAFSRVYNGIKAPLFTVILRILNDRAEAEDVMQELFLHLLRDRPEVKNPRAYIFAAGRNMAVDALRRRRGCELPEDIADGGGTEDIVCTRADVGRALSCLSFSERETVTLHINAGLKFGEIAALRREPVGTALWRYHRALKKLRRMLENY